MKFNYFTKFTSITIVGLFFTLLIFRTINRNSNWSNDLTLFGHDIKFQENVGEVQFNYGYALLQQGQYREAIPHFQKALETLPKSSVVWTDLGVSYLYMRDIDKAKQSFIRSLQIDKNSDVAYRDFVYILILQNKSAQAEKMALALLQSHPDDPYLWRLLGLAAYISKDNDLAEKSFLKSQSLSNDPITTYYLNQLHNDAPIELKE